MENFKTAITGQARKSGDSQHPESFDSPLKHKSPSKTIIRKKSVFALAVEFFKPNKAEKVEVPPLEDEQQERRSAPWNSFLSLRGFRESRNKVDDLEIARCRSSSPRKSNESTVYEFGIKRAMRRKSLQDLLGTVGTKLSLSRRQVHSEDSIPQVEAPLKAMTDSRETSPLLLPEPALPLPGAADAVLGPLYLSPDESMSNEALESHGNLEVGRNSEETSSVQPKLHTKPGLRIINVVPKPASTDNRSNPSEFYRKSQELKHMLPSLSLKRSYPAAPTDYSREVSPHAPPHVRFVDEKSPPQYRYSDDIEDVIAPESSNLDPTFTGRTLSRKERYNSIYDGPSSEQMELSTKDIDTHVALTAAKMTENSQLSTTQSRWSIDSSETDTDDMSDYNWVGKEMEVQNIIDRGKEIMTLGTLSPYLHPSSIEGVRNLASSTDPATNQTIIAVGSQDKLMNESASPIRTGDPLLRSNSHDHVQGSPTSKATWMSSASYVMRPTESEQLQSELSSFGNLTTDDDRLQGTDQINPQTINCEINHRRKPMISLENGERFRPRRANSRMISGEPVHIVYPPREFCKAHTKMYISKSCALGDLYQNHSGFSEYCLYDPSTRTYYPQALSDLVPELMELNDKGIEILWLPLEMFPVDSFNGHTDGCLSLPNDDISELERPPSYEAARVQNLASSSPQESDIMSLENAAIKKNGSQASDSSRHDSVLSENGAWVGYTDSAPCIDKVGLSNSNYTMTKISTRELFSSTEVSTISEDLQPDTDGTDDPYEVAVDSATARLYLGSLFSSTGSLRSIADAEVSGSKSPDSIMRKLKDAQSENTKHVKTWIEMEREYLDRFAPISQIHPYRRRRVAIFEAFKKLKGLADSSNDEDSRHSNDSDSGFIDAPDPEQEKWLRYREAYMDFSFEHVEDIAEYRFMDKECPVTMTSSHFLEGSNQSSSVDLSTIIEARDKGKKRTEVPCGTYVHSGEFTTFCNHFGDGAKKQQAASPKFSIPVGMPKSHGFGLDATAVHQESNDLSLGSQSRLGSEAYSDTDSTAITTLSGYMFTHYAEQLGECPAEVHNRGNCHCEEPCDNQSVLSACSHRTTDINPSFSVFGNKCPPPKTEPLDMDAGVESDTQQLSVWSKPPKIVLASAMSVQVQVCLPVTRLDLVPLLQERPIPLNSGISPRAEAMSGQSSQPRFSVQKRGLAPNGHLLNPLTESSSQKNQMIRGTSPSPSDADTEISENFGRKLKRYKRIDEEEDKENDLWWTESISYG